MAKPTEVTIEHARQNLSEIARRASMLHERFLVTFHGKPMFAVVSVEDLEQLAEGKRPQVGPAKRRR